MSETEGYDAVGYGEPSERRCYTNPAFGRDDGKRCPISAKLAPRLSDPSVRREGRPVTLLQFVVCRLNDDLDAGIVFERFGNGT